MQKKKNNSSSSVKLFTIWHAAKCGLHGINAFAQTNLNELCDLVLQTVELCNTCISALQAVTDRGDQPRQDGGAAPQPSRFSLKTGYI